LRSPAVDVAIIGAGPYGPSLAAHLSACKLSYRIFGTPMSSWRNHMLTRTWLKSDGFASSLYDPKSAFTLASYCREQSLPYADVGLPVPIETFVAYGLEFQKRFVAQHEESDVTAVYRTPSGFELTTQAGETVRSKRVVVAAGISHFSYIPPVFASLPQEFLTHSSHHKEVIGVKGRRVAVIGAGASAVDLAGLLQEADADTHLIARRAAIAFHGPSVEPRPITQRLLVPRSGLGLGWRSRLCTDAPLLLHSMPSRLRRRAVQRHLGPAPGWFAKGRFVGRVTSHLGTRMKQVGIRGNSASLISLSRMAPTPSFSSITSFALPATKSACSAWASYTGPCARRWLPLKTCPNSIVIFNPLFRAFTSWVLRPPTVSVRSAALHTVRNSRQSVLRGILPTPVSLSLLGNRAGFAQKPGHAEQSGEYKPRLCGSSAGSS
jgi:hypothetical protein